MSFFFFKNQYNYKKIFNQTKLKQMKKVIKISILAVLGLFSFNNSYAQFDKEKLSLGGGLGYYGYASVGSTLVVNIRGNYILDDKSSIAVSYNYHLPMTQSLSAYANSNTSLITPSQISVSRDRKVSINNICLNYHRYFVGETEESFGIYGLAGAGLTMANVSSTYGAYDTRYSLQKEADATYTGWIIDLGLGTNIQLMDKMNFFAEAKIGFAANNSYNSQSGTSGDNPIPFHYSVAAGVRYSIFQ